MLSDTTGLCTRRLVDAIFLTVLALIFEKGTWNPSSVGSLRHLIHLLPLLCVFVFVFLLFLCHQSNPQNCPEPSRNPGELFFNCPLQLIQ